MLVFLWLAPTSFCSSLLYIPFLEGLLQLLASQTPRRVLVITQWRTSLLCQLHFERHSLGSGHVARWQSACWVPPQVLVFFLRENSNCDVSFRGNWDYFTDTVVFYVSVRMPLCVQICLPIHACVETRGLLWLSVPCWLMIGIEYLSELDLHCFHQPLGTSCIWLPELGLQTRATVIEFYLSAVNMNSGPRASTTTTLVTEPSL